MSDAFVQLSDLTLSYGKSVAVPNLDLSIREGELIALLGPSGCGKTTTMRAIAGLLSPTGGTITIDRRDVTRVPANKRGIGLVFQSYALFPHLSAFENVAFGLRLQKLPEAEITQRTEEGLATVGLTGFEKRKPAEMSGGQQQRVALARSLVMRPKVLLLMGPTILILAPVLLPVVDEAGIDPIYFGVMFIMNCCIGLLTPPVGVVLNVVSGVGRIPLAGFSISNG